MENKQKSFMVERKTSEFIEIQLKEKKSYSKPELVFLSGSDTESGAVVKGAEWTGPFTSYRVS